MNRAEIKGGLTRDPEISQSGGYDRIQFTVAVNGTRWDSESRSQVVKTAYLMVVAWGPVAAEWMSLKKGDEVYVVGELDQYKKENKDESSTRITAFSITMIREGRSHQQQAAGPAAGGDPWA